MKIYSSADIEILDVIVKDNSYRLQEIMGSHNVVLYYDLSEYVEVPIGSYIIYKNQRYHLASTQDFKMIHSRNFQFTLTLHSEQIKLADVKMKFFTEDDPYELKFSLTASPAEFCKLIVDNMNDSFNDGWTVGDCLQSDPVTIDFNNDYCNSALQRIADAFETEWEVEGNIIHVHKIEKLKDSPISLSYGYQNGILSGLTRTQYDNSKIINRLYVETSDKNINKSTYGSKTLKMPKSYSVTFNGIQYITDPTGSYIERVTRSGRIVDGGVDLTKIYPSILGSVSSVITVDAAKNLYDIVDGLIPESLNYNNYIIPGTTMTIVFQTGALAGKEFDVKYINTDKRFEIVPLTENGETYPVEGIMPVVGDTYRVYNISLPDEYNSEASSKVLQSAVEYLYDNEQARYTYRWNLDGLYAKRNWLAIGGFLECGYFISFSDARFQVEPVSIRIISVKEFLNKPMSPTIEIANNISSKSFSAVLNKIPEQGQTINRTKSELLSYTKRRFRDAEETTKMLADALLNFSGGINPATIQTMQILLGDKSLQFRFVDDNTTPIVVEHGFTFDSNTKKFSTSSGWIQHMTLGISSITSTHALSEYKFWYIYAYDSPELTASKAYYLYIKASKTSTVGNFVLSETAIALEGEAGYYHFLCGFLNSEYNGDRSFVEVYGFTEILPGRITVDKIISPDGSTYFNLTTGEIGGKIVLKAGSSGLANIAEYAGLIGLLTDAQDDAAAAMSLANSLDSYINGAFHDGIIDESESIAIGNYLATIDDNWAEISASYAKIYANPSLSGMAKSNLYAAYTTLDGVKEELVAAIVAAIADSKITGTESEDVNILIEEYRTALINYTNAVEDANTAILSTYEYLKEAIESGDTMIAGGLILTNALLLKNLAGVMTAGISGLTSPSGKAVPWLFADAEKGDFSSVLEKAQLRKARFYMLTDGRAGMGLLKVEKDRVAICKQLKDGSGKFIGLGEEIVVFQDGNIPTVNELLTTLTKTDITYSGSTSMSESAVGNLGYSNPMTVALATDGFSSFTIRIRALLHIVIANDAVLGEEESAELVLNLYSVAGTTYTLVRQLGIITLTNNTFETRSADLVIDESFNIQEGSYVIRGEYIINCQTVVDNVTVSVTDGIISASGASAKQQIIIGQNGLARIKDANNFDYMTDTDAVFARGPGRAVVLSSTATNFMTVLGKTDMPGFLGSGSIGSTGSLSNSMGKVSGASRTSTGIYIITHSIGHTNYSVVPVVFNPSVNLIAYGVSKTNTSITIRIINPHTDTLTNSAFDFIINGNNA